MLAPCPILYPSPTTGTTALRPSTRGSTMSTNPCLTSSGLLIGDNPMSSEGLNNLKTVMRAHFDYESGLYCNAEAYHECDQHNEKHNTFFNQLVAVQVPVSEKDFQWAANWRV